MSIKLKIYKWNGFSSHPLYDKILTELNRTVDCDRQ